MSSFLFLPEKQTKYICAWPTKISSKMWQDLLRIPISTTMNYNLSGDLADRSSKKEWMEERMHMGRKWYDKKGFGEEEWTDSCKIEDTFFPFICFLLCQSAVGFFRALLANSSFFIHFFAPLLTHPFFSPFSPLTWTFTFFS